MKRFPIVLTVLALGAAGFAAASIASGGRFVQMLTGTGATVTTPTVTTQTVTTQTVTTTPTTTEEQGGGRRVTICHHTGSKKHPFHTITVDQHAVKAHLRHHDTLGACPTVAPTTTTSKDAGKHGHKGKGKSNDQHGKPVVAPTPPTTTTTTTSDDSSHGNSGNHGNSGDHGNGHGHGKP